MKNDETKWMVFTKQDVILIPLYAVRELYDPAQIQKLIFLLQDKVGLIGNVFEFEAGDYGATCHEILYMLSKFSKINYVKILHQRRNMSIDHFPQYMITDKGSKYIKEKFNFLEEDIKNNIIELCYFVLRCSFTQLVKSMNESYPEMAKNCIFKEDR